MGLNDIYQDNSAGFGGGASSGGGFNTPPSNAFKMPKASNLPGPNASGNSIAPVPKLNDASRGAMPVLGMRQLMGQGQGQNNFRPQQILPNERTPRLPGQGNPLPKDQIQPPPFDNARLGQLLQNANPMLIRYLMTMFGARR